MHTFASSSLFPGIARTHLNCQLLVPETLSAVPTQLYVFMFGNWIMRLNQVKLTNNAFSSIFLYLLNSLGLIHRVTLTDSYVDKSHMALGRTGQAARREKWLEVP